MNQIMKRILAEYVTHEDHPEVKNDMEGAMQDHIDLLKEDQKALESITEIEGDKTQNAVPGAHEVCDECGQVVENGECCDSELRNADSCDCGCNFDFSDDFVEKNMVAKRIASMQK